MGVVSTTIAPPRPVHRYLRREAIDGLVDAVDQARVVKLTAPAGFGKTSTMLRWAELLAERNRPVLWIAGRAGIDSLDAMQTALRESLVLAGAAPMGAGTGITAREWLDGIIQLGEPRPIVFIDDVQLLPLDVLEFLERIIAWARDAHTIVLASRGECDMNLARLRSLGHLAEVGARDLTLRSDEAAELFLQQAEMPIADDDLQKIVLDTQGWPAGIVLAAKSWRRDRMEGLPSQGGATGLRHEFASYFHEEVLALQPEHIRDFLVDTSILDVLTPENCAAVVETRDARRILDEVFERGLFLIELDREASCFRYYALFREMVFGRLMRRAPERAAALHRRASLYFAETKDFERALDHAARSGDTEFLADQLESLADTMTYCGLLYRVDELARALPWDLQSTRPALLLAMSWRHSRRLAFKSADRMIEAAGIALQERLQDGRCDEYEYEQMQLHVRHRKIMLEAARDNMPVVERESELLLNELGDDYPYLSCTLLAQLLSARRELYHFHDMLRLEAEMRRALGRPGSDFASIALKTSVAPTLVALGRTKVARQLLSEACDLARSMEGLNSGLVTLPALPLAELLYECGELEEASALVDQYLPSIRQWSFVDQLASGYLVRSRLAAAAGDVVGALSGLEEAQLVAAECGLDRLRGLLLSEQVCVLVRAGRIDQAEKLFEASDLYPAGEPVPTLNPTRLSECLAVAWLRIEMHRYRLGRSRKIAKRWLEFVRKRGAVRSAITFQLLLAEIAVLSGNRSEARRSVRDAVELAEPGGWIRPFIDEGDAIALLLTEAYASGPSLAWPTDRFAARLVAVLQGEPALGEVEENFGLGSGLSSREVEILSMVSGGLRNREIGDRLGLTEGTVKWYMQQIYDKLGVRRRPQAVIRARQLGILS